MALILVADDDTDICELVEFKLTNAGHRVIRAADGAQALQHVEGHDFDLLLLDCMMPHLTGQQVLATVRTTHVHRRVPVILMSAQADAETVATGHELGADAFMAKPFSLAPLCEDIDALLSRQGEARA